MRKKVSVAVVVAFYCIVRQNVIEVEAVRRGCTVHLIYRLEVLHRKCLEYI